MFDEQRRGGLLIQVLFPATLLVAMFAEWNETPSAAPGPSGPPLLPGTTPVVSGYGAIATRHEDPNNAVAVPDGRIYYYVYANGSIAIGPPLPGKTAYPGVTQGYVYTAGKAKAMLANLRQFPGNAAKIDEVLSRGQAPGGQPTIQTIRARAAARGPLTGRDKSAAESTGEGHRLAAQGKHNEAAAYYVAAYRVIPSLTAARRVHGAYVKANNHDEARHWIDIVNEERRKPAAAPALQRGTYTVQASSPTAAVQFSPQVPAGMTGTPVQPAAATSPAAKQQAATNELGLWTRTKLNKIRGIAVFPRVETRTNQGVTLVGVPARYQADGGAALKNLKNKTARIAHKHGLHAAVAGPNPAPGQPGWTEIVIGFADSRSPGAFHPVMGSWEKLGHTAKGQARRIGRGAQSAWRATKRPFERKV